MQTDGKIAVLAACQVWDRGKGCFFVGLKRTRRRHLGLPIYEDRFGRQMVIEGAE